MHPGPWRERAKEGAGDPETDLPDATGELQHPTDLPPDVEACQ